MAARDQDDREQTERLSGAEMLVGCAELNARLSRASAAPRSEDLRRILGALEAASNLAMSVFPNTGLCELKENLDPVTALDRAINSLLIERLVQQGEGWLSEETKDDGSRLRRDRVRIVDPLDGTREYIAGIPEWCISIALVEGRAGGRWRDLQSRYRRDLPGF